MRANFAMTGESRRDVRVAENTRVLWHIPKNGLVGQGRVRNISNSGMLVEMACEETFPEQSNFSFDSNLNAANYIPEEAKLIWRKKKRFSDNQYLCGVQFGELPENISSRLNIRVEEGVRKLVRSWKAQRALRYSLSAITVALLGYSLWLGGSIYKDISETNERLLVAFSQQAELTREYQALYADTTRRLADATIELNQLAALYQESQQTLAANRQELAVLQSVLAQTEGLLEKSQSGAPVVQQQAAASVVDPALLRQTPPDIFEIGQGQRLIALYKENIAQVRAQIRQIKREDRMVRIAALRERDRIKLMHGNGGYLTKSGQLVKVDEARYNAAAMEPGQAASRVRVDVTVFQE